MKTKAFKRLNKPFNILVNKTSVFSTNQY